MRRANIDRVWKALADPTRREILDRLRDAPRTTGSLCDEFDLTRFAVMKHLSVLVEANLVMARRNGRERWNHLNVIPLRRIYERWMRPHQERWASSLLELKRRAETGEADMKQESMALRRIDIEQEIAIKAPRERVFDALVGDISAWWGAPYLRSEATTAIIVEPKIGGRMFERWGDEEGALWGHVTYVERPVRLELVGQIAMAGAIHGHLSYTLEAKGQGTLLKLSHWAVGDLPDTVKANFEAGWADLLNVRLREHMETGARHGLARKRPVRALRPNRLG